MGFSLGGLFSGASSGAGLGSMFGPIGTAIGAIGGGLMGGMGGEQSGGETVTPGQVMPEWQKALGSNLATYLNKYLNNYDPSAVYGGRLSSGMTDSESIGQNLLTKYLGSQGYGGDFTAAQKQIEDTLAGTFADPNASPFIKAMRDANAFELQNQLDASRRGAGARGKFYSTAAMGEEGKLRAAANRDLGTQIGQFIQNERQNMLSAVPQALSMDQYLNQAVPSAQMNAASTYGSLSRTLEQADLERQYQEWQRQQKSNAGIVNAAAGLYGSNPNMGITSFTTPIQESNPTTSALTGIQNLFGSGGALNGFGSQIANFFKPQPTQSQILGFNTAMYR
jgi:hypothetical protein